MEIKRVYELLNIERECVMRGNTCNRDCINCGLAQDDKELIEMYDILIKLIGSYLPTWKTMEINWGKRK